MLGSRRQRGKKTRALRLYFATDIHGSDVCFRKFLAAAKVYEADALILGGDFAGKALVPVLPAGDGSLTARVEGQNVTMPEAEWDRLAAGINRAGFYPVRMEAGELAALEVDPAALDRLFRREIAAQLQRWCDLAAERLDPAVRCIITPGNDDPVEADAVLAAHPRVECPEAELCDLGPVAMASLGVVPTTPWNTERETSEEDLGKQISAMLDQVPEGKEAILNIHCPPYASGLDDAPELDDTLKPVIRGGRPSIIPVGSQAVRDAITRYQPTIGLHGHIHESRAAQKIGKTLCVNPGSDYGTGVLRGAVEDVTTFGKYLGGSATNVAVAAARLGHGAAVITRTGADPFGRFVHQALKGYGVDDRFVTAVPGLPTPVTFCEIFPPDHFPIYFYRYPKAPDLEIRADELDGDAIRAARVFWVTVTGLSAEPSRSATLAALETRGRAGVTVLDLDYRPSFWPSPQEARRWVQAALGHVTVAVGNLDECEVAVAERDPLRAARALRDRGAELAVVKQGPLGVLAMGPGGVVETPPVPVEVLNGIGAGDAFGGALCHG